MPARTNFSIARIGRTPHVLELIKADGDALEGNLAPRQADVLEACEGFMEDILEILGGEEALVRLTLWNSGGPGRDELDFGFRLERNLRDPKD